MADWNQRAHISRNTSLCFSWLHGSNGLLLDNCAV